MPSPKSKRYLLKILPFGIIPCLFAVVYSLLEQGILGDHPVYPSTGNVYTFNVLIPTLISFILGLFIGMFEVGFLSKVFIKSGFAKKISIKTLIYFFIIFAAITIISTISTAFYFNASPFSTVVWDDVQNFLSSFALWSIMLYFTMGVVTCLFYSEIANNVGQNVLLNFFMGKYHHPKEEERVFLFLDMKSSTTIAEQLGHTTYFQLLRDYYSDLSDAIIRFGGEIYQYVGDEVVVTWRLKPNEKNSESIDCFFAMQQALASKSAKYSRKYGVVPTFKAGIHLGKVTTGEIGKIKKDIVFTGDVLNTTARIQGLCNAYKVQLLLSQELVEALDLITTHKAYELGQTELRGRDEKITLYSI
ncbi:MAG: adenylate/guanylate cyclase domain-containing protein [Bacteroidota bacterium]